MDKDKNKKLIESLEDIQPSKIDQDFINIQPFQQDIMDAIIKAFSLYRVFFYVHGNSDPSFSLKMSGESFEVIKNRIEELAVQEGVVDQVQVERSNTKLSHINVYSPEMFHITAKMILT